MTIQNSLARYRDRVNAALESWLPPADSRPESLHTAMRYCVLGSAKRIRPTLVYATGDALGLDAALLDGPACAVELVHTYSLVHDDLPAMDDDDLRRGRPTCHRAFDEATAILVGDALQVLAFRILASDSTMTADADTRLRMIDLLAGAIGTAGMAGGQAIDLASAGSALDVTELEHMHELKTGKLIRASVLLAALNLAEPEPALIEALGLYGHLIGLAFQIWDDILDVEGDVEALGKSPGSDVAKNKITYPSVVGIQEAKRRADTLQQQAVEAIAGMGEMNLPLVHLSEFMVNRRH